MARAKVRRENFFMRFSGAIGTAILSMALALPCPVALAQTAPAAGAGSPAEVVWEFDAYYSSVGLHVPLTDQPIPDSRGGTEVEIYRELLVGSLRPRMMLLELSVNPMPVLGTYLRRHHPGFYADGDVGRDSNVVESLTAGFREPSALSLFFGSALNFVHPGEERRDTNKGYVGYLVSAGRKHIKDNVLIDDPWVELEWKLKGTREFRDEEFAWSFRVGAKFHDNPDIADTAYVGAKRSHVDFGGGWLAYLRNTEFSFKLDFTQDRPSFAFAEAIVGKRWPVKDRRYAFALDVGAIVENTRLYSGGLRDATDDVIFVVRPNLKF